MVLELVRGEELEREQGMLSAELYNRFHLLFSRTAGESLIVPIRSMAYLAVIDRDEIVFADGQGQHAVEVAWTDFRASGRERLCDPVSYTCIYYHRKGRDLMYRLPGEFLRALQLMAKRKPGSGSASVTLLDKG